MAFMAHEPKALIYIEFKFKMRLCLPFIPEWVRADVAGWLHGEMLLHHDALGNEIGAILMQEGRALDFESQSLKGKDLQKPICEKEMMALLNALKKQCPYLIGRHFNVKTDHDSLIYFLEQRLSLEEQQKWVTKILGYDFEIV
jgi:hypothetical protein